MEAIQRSLNSDLSIIDVDLAIALTSSVKTSHHEATVATETSLLTAQRTGATITALRKDIVINDRIGGGAFSAVYKGTWRGAVVALKVLPSILAAAAGRSSFESELAVLTSLRHPRVLTLMAICLDPLPTEGSVGLVTEYMECGSLFNILHGGEQEQSTAQRGSNRAEVRPETDFMKARCALDVADGMRFLHGSGLIHRDLKSGNVLVDGDGRCKIADFGTSKFREEAMTHVTG
jgi:serine/threonine protein kinase